MGGQDPGTGGSDLEQQSTPQWHIPDEVRVGVLAGVEEFETWLQAHLMRCAACRKPIIDLLGEIQGTMAVSDEGGVECAEARNALFHYLEGDREPPFMLLQHIIICDSCSETFYEPAKATAVLEFNPDETGEAG
jgi:predicted anti-sigma-YlaC factor YlaD